MTRGQADRGGDVSKVAMKPMAAGGGGPYSQERTGEVICLNPGFERKAFNQSIKGSSSSNEYPIILVCSTPKDWREPDDMQDNHIKFSEQGIYHYLMGEFTLPKSYCIFF